MVVFRAFQSSPDPEAGRNEKPLRKASREQQVPILARPGGRAQRRDSPRRSSGPGFQSSPDPEAGRNAIRPHEVGLLLVVPILARPGGRAQPLRRGEPAVAAMVPILARPGGRAQLHPELLPRYTGPPHRVPILARPGGRAQQALTPRAVRAVQGSNPRPTRRPGATGMLSRSALYQEVPILARPGGRAQRR